MPEIEIAQRRNLDVAPQRSVEEVVAAVGAARTQLIDVWEAIALVEALGYNDARINRDFGFSNTRAFGEFVFDKLAHRPHRPPGIGNDQPERTALRDFADSLGASSVVALPWLAFFIAGRLRPDVLRLPRNQPSPLGLALMVSLIVTGGFVQAMSRRGQFYFGAKQPGLAALVCGYLFRVGAIVSVAAAGIGLLAGWYFKLADWPYLVLAVDDFVILCAVWLTCGLLTVRNDQWRAPAAFFAGAIAFVVARFGSGSVFVAEFAAAGTVLMAGAVQLPSVFAQPDGGTRLLSVPLPRKAVLLYGLLPFLSYGAVYFCFLFADRFSIRPAPLGMDLALTTFLLAVAGVEYANLRFSHHLRGALKAPFPGGSDGFRRTVGRFHLGALALVVVSFALTATIVGAIARWLLSGEATAVWTTLALGDIGYLLLALGLLNALVLFALNRPWPAVGSLTMGLVLNIAAGVIAGGAVFVLLSTISVWRTIRRADHAVAQV